MSTSYLDQDGLQDYTTKLVAKLKTILATKSDIGTPLMAATVAAMTDTTKIYVYTGSETGYITGHWYYYNGSAWTDGGMYNSPTDIDPTLTIQGYAADAKAVGDIKADKDGYYEDLSVGRADNIISDVAAVDKTPYLIRATGGSIEAGDTVKQKAIVGVSGRFYQRDTLQSSSSSSVNGWIRSNSTYMSLTLSGRTYTLTSDVNDSHYKNVRSTNAWATRDHIFFCCADVQVSDSSTTGYLSMGTNEAGGPKVTFFSVTGPTNGFVHMAAIKKYTEQSALTGKFFMRLNGLAPTNSYAQFRELQVIDLTILFGEEVAEYILARENAEAGAGVAIFRSMFPNKYYTGTTSATIYAARPDKKICTGFNAYNLTTSKAQVIPNQEYTIEGNYTSYTYTPRGSTVVTTVLSSDTDASNPTFDFAGEVEFTGADSDLCMHLRYDGSRDGEKASYKAREYELNVANDSNNGNLRGYFKLDSNNNIYTVGDTYEPDGTITSRMIVSTCNTFTWNQDSVNGVFYTSVPNMKLGGGIVSFTNTWNRWHGSLSEIPDYSFWNEENEYSSTNLVVKASSYANVTALLNAIGTSTIVYESVTPTTYSGTPYQETQLIDNWGTEEYVDDGTYARQMPCGHISDYLQDLKAKVEMTPNLPSIDGLYLLRRQGGVYTYSPMSLNKFVITNTSTPSSGTNNAAFIDKTFEEITTAYEEGKHLQLRIRTDDFDGIAEFDGIVFDDYGDVSDFRFSMVDPVNSLTYGGSIVKDEITGSGYVIISIW